MRAEISGITDVFFRAMEAGWAQEASTVSIPQFPGSKVISSGCTVRWAITSAAVTALAFARISSLDWAPGWPTMVATGMLGMPRPTDVAAAWLRKPSQTSELVG